MSYDFLYTVENNIATITLNRPEVLNALTLEICAQLRDLFETLRHDDSVKAVIITGAGRAFCSGDDLDAVTAERYGLVNKLVPREQVLIAAREWAERLASGPTYAIGMTKTLVNNEWGMDVVSAVEAEAQAQALMMMGADHRAFYEAFKEKKKPEFSGK